MIVIETLQDRQDMLADFETLAVFDPSGSAVTVTGIFDESFLATDIQTGVQYSGDQPVFFALTPTVSGFAQSTQVRIGVKLFTVADVQGTGDGSYSNVILHRS